MRYIKLIDKFFKKVNEDHVGEYAANSAYFSFLSFIPFIILLLSLIKYIDIEKDTLIYILEAILPTITKNSVLDIIQETYSKSFETISISAIFMLWSAANSFYALNLGLSSIYKSKGEKENNYFFQRIKGMVGTLAIIISIIVVLILLVFGNRINIILNEKFPHLIGKYMYILDIRSILVIVWLFIMFILIYRFVPNRKGKGLKYQIPGAIFASIGWLFISFFFSIYVDIFTNFSIIYGSLGTITLILMWLYAIIYVILLGAEINSMVENYYLIKKRK